MAGRVTVVGIAALLAVVVFAKPFDRLMGRFQQGPPPRRWRYKCLECGHVVTRMHRQQYPPPCNRCNGKTKLVRRRRQG